MREWRPHQGPQERFLRCPTFEALYGGAAGAGKSETLMIYPTRWIKNPKFRAIIFRRTIPELKRYLVERTPEFYRPLGGIYNRTDRKWTFPSGAVIELGAMQHVQDRFNYDSVEYQCVCFDELTTFEKTQYTYMITRMRTTDPALPIRLRAATNPGGPGHEWVLERFAPWLYQPGEYEDEWEGPYASPEERMAFLKEGDTEESVPIGTPASVTRTFFPATIDDNPSIDADYKYRLQQTDALTFAQKRYGDWMARPAPGLFFRRDMFAGRYLDVCPTDAIMRVRHWDLAATADPDADPAEVADKGPDWTCGVRVCIRRNLTYVVEDVARARVGPDEIEGYLAATADADRAEFDGAKHVLQTIEQEPGASGKIVANSLLKALRGHWAKSVRPTGSKVERAKPSAGQARAGNVYMVKAPWNRVFIAEAEAFPFGKKDQIDGFSGAMGELMGASRKRAASGGRRQMPRRMGGY
ncbi:MAG: terminase family protein [Planctomycetota bacterium]